MPIFRVHKNKEHPYTIIDNTSVNDKRLSAKAKGILLFLISKPDHWFTNLPNLISSFTDGERSIRSGVNELIKFGYIIRTHVRKDDGRFSFYDYSVYEQPIKETIDASASSPVCRNAVLDNAVLDNSTLLNTDKKENTDSSNSTSSSTTTVKISAAADLSLINLKNSTIKLLTSLNIINHKILFDLFPISVIFKYATWIQERNCKMNNPTGFLITSIKEKWLDLVAADFSKSSPLLFYYRCKKCGSVFGYESSQSNYDFCNKCLKGS